MSAEAKAKHAQAMRNNILPDLQESRSLRALGDIHAIVNMWGETARDHAEGRGYRLKPQGPEFFKLCRAINDGCIEAWEAILKRLEGEAVPTPAEPAPPTPIDRARPAKSTSAPQSTFQALVRNVLTSPRHPVSQATREATETALRYFREAFGEPEAAAIKKQMVTEWLELLARLPARLTAAERKMPLRDVVARYTEQEDAPRLSPKTLSQHLGMLSAAWGKAQDDGLIADNLPNPFKRKIVRQARPQMQELSTAELKAIFALPIFTDGTRPTSGKGEASYWIPLLLLWTGARPEEIAQLLVSDVTQDPQSGRWMLKITDEGEHPHKGKRGLKTSKALSGRRVFPIPQGLLDLNFVAYVESVRKAGEQALFPKLRTKGLRGMLHAGWAEWWRNYVREQGVLPKGVARRPAREFRHAWTTAARKSGLPREAAEYIQGHRASGGSAHEVYGSREPLGFHIDKLRFDGLDLRGVRPWTPPQ